MLLRHDLLGETRRAVEHFVADVLGLLGLQELADLVLILLVQAFALVDEVVETAHAHSFARPPARRPDQSCRDGSPSGTPAHRQRPHAPWEPADAEKPPGSLTPGGFSEQLRRRTLLEDL